MSRELSLSRSFVVSTVKALADAHIMSDGNLATFMESITKEFGELKVLGSGASRRVYELPCGLVLKVAVKNYNDHDQNEVEYKTQKLYPKDVSKVYLWICDKSKKFPHFRLPDNKTPINIIVARQAEVFGDIPKKYEARLKYLQEKFSDVCSYNVGLVNKRLLLIDAGLGTVNYELGG